MYSNAEPTPQPGAQPTPMTSVCEKPTSQELEMENARLHRLVADLLVRNQQLRLQLKVSALALSERG